MISHMTEYIKSTAAGISLWSRYDAKIRTKLFVVELNTRQQSNEVNFCGCPKWEKDYPGGQDLTAT